MQTTWADSTQRNHGGVCDVDTELGTMFDASVSISGTVDDGVGFGKELQQSILDVGITDNSVIRAWYTSPEDGHVKVVRSSHVGHMLWATTPGYEHMVRGLLDRFTLTTVGSSCFCGREIVQSEDVSVSGRDV